MNMIYNLVIAYLFLCDVHAYMSNGGNRNRPRGCVCANMSLSACLSVQQQCSQAVIHPALICIPGQKKLCDTVAKSTTLQQPMPLSLLLFPMSLSFLATLPTKPQDNYGSASSEHTFTSFLNPAFPPFLSFCLCVSLFLHCWRMTYCSCHQGSVGVWLIERVCVCVSVDGHLGSWPSSWILSLLLNSDFLSLSLPPSLSQFCLHRQLGMQ